MRLAAFAALVLALVAGAAFLTRPTGADFDRMLDRAVRERIANTDIDASGDAVGTIALVGCKLRPTDCVALLREALEVTVTPGWLTTRVEFGGMNRKGRCLGAFRRFWCGEELTGG